MNTKSISKKKLVVAGSLLLLLILILLFNAKVHEWYLKVADSLKEAKFIKKYAVAYEESKRKRVDSIIYIDDDNLSILKESELSVVFFTTLYCGCCHYTKIQFEKLSGDKDFKTIDFVHVDGYWNRSIQKHYKIRAYPSVYLMKNSKKIFKVRSLRTAELKWLNDKNLETYPLVKENFKKELKGVYEKTDG